MGRYHEVDLPKNLSNKGWMIEGRLLTSHNLQRILMNMHYGHPSHEQWGNASDRLHDAAMKKLKRAGLVEHQKKPERKWVLTQAGKDCMDYLYD